MNAIKAFEDNINAQLEELYTERRIAMGNLVDIDRTICRLETLADLNELHRSNNNRQTQEKESVDPEK